MFLNSGYLQSDENYNTVYEVVSVLLKWFHLGKEVSDIFVIVLYDLRMIVYSK